MTQTPDDAALVARLQTEADRPDYQAGDGMDWCQVDANFLRETATTLEAKDRRIAELEAALRLIADAEFVDVMCDPGWPIRIARATLEPSPPHPTGSTPPASPKAS